MSVGTILWLKSGDPLMWGLTLSQVDFAGSFILLNFPTSQFPHLSPSHSYHLIRLWRVNVRQYRKMCWPLWRKSSSWPYIFKILSLLLIISCLLERPLYCFGLSAGRSYMVFDFSPSIPYLFPNWLSFKTYFQITLRLVSIGIFLLPSFQVTLAALNKLLEGYTHFLPA